MTPVDASARADQRPDPQVVIIGAGPAGLTAAYQLNKHDVAATVLESDNIVGGISRTVERDGWRFDIGGHRFFTKVKPVEELWHEILPAEDFLLRPRMSRIFYDGKYFDYPLKASNALKNLGFVEATRCVASYFYARADGGVRRLLGRPRADTSLEDWITARFGRRLYEHFFKTYNEKVWGVSASEIQADWAAQRIKNMSLLNAGLNAVIDELSRYLPFLAKRKATDITSLIEEFEYPKYGPGQMWEVCQEKVEAAGTKVHMSTRATKVRHADGQAVAVVAATRDGVETEYPCDEVISSMPMSQLLRAMDPPVPADVLQAADDLAYRDFLTVALVVPESASFPDNWIYIHSPEVEVGRIQNFASWSPYMVKEGRTCLGLEYFVFEGDHLWSADDADLVELAKRELEHIGLVPASAVEAGYVVRMPKAYPFYDEHYKANVQRLRDWLVANTPNVHPVGRNGMHRYNNQDHSMYTAMLTVENLVEGTHHDVWEVNVEEEYHEEKADAAAASSGGGGTGRDAPVISRDAYGPDHPVNRTSP
ncbi:NAD(P)/FAD-dependent oxidoreductase [Rhabdothermincola salaria]|uniref:NAD(P)/FAD-dependent oxidoreductase n=1 Tax=Rhabdothermincola salaria TaxID=2903142 RepID=UPI001E5530E3|nr:NAD(P)/FAD-dependent oxidoreductase [Rhabdothermincola salaria]MCD9623004.1 NAD(P)/FAD-dependent oxidoreductase [Rhabdothermincola salaria]